MSIEKYGGLADNTAKKYGIDPGLFRALIQQESGWNPQARSGVGAYGLTQVMPFHNADLSTPASQLDFGAKYFSTQLKAFDNDPRKALAAYNAGPGRVQQYGGVPPPSFAEGQTYNYVKNIMAAWGGDNATVPAGAPSPERISPLQGAPQVAAAPAAPHINIPPAARKIMENNSRRIKAGKGIDVKGNRKLAKIMAPIVRANKAARVPAEGGAPIVAGAGNVGGHYHGDGHDHSHDNMVEITPGQGWGGSEGFIKSAHGDLPDGFAITSAKRDRQHTKSGGTSDHWSGNTNAYAHDIGWGSSQPTSASDAYASRIVAALGGPANWGATGGNFKGSRDGYNYQVIYRSNVGGNHFNHIHFGARKA